MTKLVCPECRHENEPERIYCHNCGGRLDRSAIRKENAANEETPEVTQARLKKLMDPARGRSKAIGLKVVKILLGAALAAAVVEMLLPPDLPPAVKSLELAPMISMDLLSAIESRQSAQLVYNQQQVNDYLASAIRRSNSPAKEGYFPIKRLYAQFDEGKFSIDTAYNCFGLPLYVAGSYRVQIDQGKIAANCESGHIGRMPVHPLVMQRLGLLLGKTWATLDREKKQVARLAGIEFHPQSVTLIVAR